LILQHYALGFTTECCCSFTLALSESKVEQFFDVFFGVSLYYFPQFSYLDQDKWVWEEKGMKETYKIEHTKIFVFKLCALRAIPYEHGL
jgi:hypothetical protein